MLEFECGHVQSHVNGGSLEVGNLRPICGSCNKSMGSKLLFDYIKEKFPAHYPLVEEDELIFRFRQLKVKEVNEKIISSLMSPDLSDSNESLFSSSESDDSGCCFTNKRGDLCDKEVHSHSYCKAHLFEGFENGSIAHTKFPANHPKCQFKLMKGKNKNRVCGKVSESNGYCRQHLYKLLE